MTLRISALLAALVGSFFAIRLAGSAPEGPHAPEENRKEELPQKCPSLEELFPKKSDYLIATVADPTDPPLAIDFDRSISAIVAAANSYGYVLERFVLPWDMPKESEDAANARLKEARW